MAVYHDRNRLPTIRPVDWQKQVTVPDIICMCISCYLRHEDTIPYIYKFSRNVNFEVFMVHYYLQIFIGKTFACIDWRAGYT